LLAAPIKSKETQAEEVVELAEDVFSKVSQYLQGELLGLDFFEFHWPEVEIERQVFA